MSYGYPPPQPPEWPLRPSELERPPARSSSWIWAIVAISGVGILGLAMCCGGGVWLMSFGIGVITTEIEDQLRDNPKVQEHVGEISEFTMDWSRSFATADDDTYVYRVKGTKGGGKVTVKQITNDDGDEEIVSADLRLDSGKTVQLVP